MSDILSYMHCPHIWPEVMPRPIDSASYCMGNVLFLISINVIMAKNKKLWFLVSWPTILSLFGIIHTGNNYEKHAHFYHKEHINTCYWKQGCKIDK